MTRSGVLIGASAAMLALTVAGFGQSVEEFQKLMRPAAAANAKLQKTVGTDLAAAGPAAADVKSTFKEIEAYFAKHNVADAQTFSKNIQTAADEVEAAAKAGNQQEAVAAAKKIGAGCQGCHATHRDKAPDGSYIIK